mgnify:CR=1 FL=1
MVLAVVEILVVLAVLLLAARGLSRLLGHVKAIPTVYLILYRNGRIVRQGPGLSFFYFAPNATLVSIPLETMDAPFMFEEVSADFQAVTVQGRATYRVAEPAVLAGMMNFTLRPDRRGYVSKDPQQLSARVVTVIQVQVRNVLETMPLEALLRNARALEAEVREGVAAAPALRALGIALVDLAILAVKPSPETGRALEADMREQILKRADDATYARRNAAIVQERACRSGRSARTNSTPISRWRPSGGRSARRSWKPSGPSRRSASASARRRSAAGSPSRNATAR